MQAIHRTAVAHVPEDVTAAWLEAVLGRPVRLIDRTESTSTWASHVRVVIDAGGAGGPLKLRVKIGSAKVFGHSEVDYYLHDFADLPDAPLVRCHHGAADATHYVLILDDLSDTHRNQDHVPVTEVYGRGLVESMVQLHAHKWPRPPPDPAAWSWPPPGSDTLLAAMEDGFTPGERARVQQVFDWLPDALARRIEDPAGFSWIHGDLNPGNILAPIDGSGQVLLLDYQPFGGAAATGQLALGDLGYAMVLWWPEQASREFAEPLVAHWHACLESRGLGYASADRLRDDWYLCVAQTLLVPASRCGEPGAVVSHRKLWEMHVRRVLAALADMDAR